MKLSTGITLFNKQPYKEYKIHKNEILEKNCNFSVPIIDNNDNINIKTQKKKYLEKKEKVTLIKSILNKNERNSRSKSNSNSKEFKQRYKSINNNINQNNYLNNTSVNKNQLYNDKNKYIFSSYILNPLYGMKIYENVINKIFEYLKNIMSEKIFINIKKMFIKYIYEELHIKTDLLLTKTDNELMNINLKLFYNKTSQVNRVNSKNKKQKDFSFTRNYNNKYIKNHSYNTTKINMSKQFIFNGLLKNHNSLYYLNKESVKAQGVPFSSNLSKSPPKSKSISKSGSKEKKLINKKINKNYYSNNTIFDPDIHVFKILNQRKKNNGIYKNFNNNNKNKVKKQLNSNFILFKKYKNNNGLKKKISSFIVYSEKNNENVNCNNSLKILENKDKNPEKIFKENKDNNKNDDQIKRIKSDLDENLKFLFNFSYENFLNRDSESESKKTVSDYNNIQTNNKNNNKINSKTNNSQMQDILYHPKFK